MRVVLNVYTFSAPVVARYTLDEYVRPLDVVIIADGYVGFHIIPFKRQVVCDGEAAIDYRVGKTEDAFEDHQDLTGVEIGILVTKELLATVDSLGGGGDAPLHVVVF